MSVEAVPRHMLMWSSNFSLSCVTIVSSLTFPFFVSFGSDTLEQNQIHEYEYRPMVCIHVEHINCYKKNKCFTTA